MGLKQLNLVNLKNNLSSRLSFKESAFGWDGLSTFIFSNFVLLTTLGLGFFWLFFQTLKTALLTPSECLPCNILLIAGLRLQNNQLTAEFKQRLERARVLADSVAMDELQIIILGGCTGSNQISEARAGADFLLSQGLDAKTLILEEQSRHTLENLQNARILLTEQRTSAVCENASAEYSDLSAVIISSRYHLYRLLTLSRGLQMNLLPVAAEECFELSLGNLLRVLKEVYYLHWYWSGKLWVFITANKKSRVRIT